MNIRSATEEDINGILPLIPQIYRTKELPDNSKQTLEEQIKSNNCDVLVAEEDGKILGAGTIIYIKNPGHKTPYAYLEGIVVDDAARGKGVGTALSKKVIELAKTKNCYKIIFTSGMEREEAHKFYEDLGFKKWGFEFRMDL